LIPQSRLPTKYQTEFIVSAIDKTKLDKSKLDENGKRKI
jgi:hypothetical protein